jgi:glycosyltransferase involved in cell wall biosynthesis
VDDGVTGIVAPPDEIGARILDLLVDRERRERLAAAALERSKQFSWERAATAMLEIIYDEIDGARRTRPLSAAATIPKS